jgi:hypothetical protein
MNESDLVTVLGTLVSGEVHPDAAPENTPLPYITYQQVGGRPINYLEGQGSDKKHSRIQIWAFSQTRQECMTLIRQIENLVVQAPLLANIEGAAIAYHDTQTKIRGAHQDFSFWITA